MITSLRLAPWLVLLAAPPAGAGVLAITVTDAAGRPLPDAVALLEPAGAKAPVPRPLADVEIAQSKRRFQPRVTLITPGTRVAFPNFDTVRHHVYSFSPIRSFELKLYAGTPAKPVVFDKPGTAALGCNVHDQMSAWVHVVDTPLFGKTDARGEATLDVPAGQHLLRAWHFSQGETGLPAETALTVATGAQRAVLRLKAGG